MKCIATTIALLVTYSLWAQQSPKIIKFEWKSEDDSLKANISINLNEGNSNSVSIFNLNVNALDTETKLFEGLNAKASVIKIDLLFKDDNTKSYLYLCNEVVNKILPFIQNKYLINSNNFILSGNNAGALIVLSCAMFYPDKVNKTALFFNFDHSDFFVAEKIPALINKMKGKVFIHYIITDNKVIPKFEAINDLANAIGLQSSCTVYKVETDGQISTDILNEGINWLVANGNNFIIKVDN